MAEITAAMVKELRDSTGLGMMDCKQALVASKGDMALAIENLRKSSGLKAAKKAGRIAADGLLAAKVEKGKGVLVEVNCETDFAARDENFAGFVQQVTDAVFKAGDAKTEGLLESERQALVQKIGENISIRRAEVFTGEDQVLDYVHTNGKIGVLLALKGGSAQLGREVAMHIAAMAPQVVTPDQAPAELLEKEREIYAAQAQDSGKPPEIVQKMIEGRVRKYLAEISLAEQPFVKDGSVKVGGLLKKENAQVTRFVRYEVGEGIDKAEADFAAEVAEAQQLGNN